MHPVERAVGEEGCGRQRGGDDQRHVIGVPAREQIAMQRPGEGTASLLDGGRVIILLTRSFRSTPPARVDADDRVAAAVRRGDLGQRAEASSEIDADLDEPAAVGKAQSRLLLRGSPAKPARDVVPGHRTSHLACVERSIGPCGHGWPPAGAY
jgi:hypothetical protein